MGFCTAASGTFAPLTFLTMALSPFQIEVCQLLARGRTAPGAYLAGGSALGTWLDTPRQSRDFDLFHDTLESLEATFESDERTLQAGGYTLEIVRRREGFVEAIAARKGQSVEIQWLREGAFRFFPLQEHPILGWTLHPFDLATNKILALVGRVEARDWVDALACHERVAPLGTLAFAACGKDEGWNPHLVLEEAARTAHYSREEILELDWSGPPPNFALLKSSWREAMREARTALTTLPPAQVGNAVLNRDGTPFRGNPDALEHALQSDELLFHPGHIGGVWPRVK